MTMMPFTCTFLFPLLQPGRQHLYPAIAPFCSPTHGLRSQLRYTRVAYPGLTIRLRHLLWVVVTHLKLAQSLFRRQGTSSVFALLALPVALPGACRQKEKGLLSLAHVACGSHVLSDVGWQSACQTLL
jgi:hypothetical protein